MKLAIPTTALDQHLVVLGKTGSGKSSALRHVVEHLLAANKRVCIVDPKGDWWGLKLSADGKGPGLPVIMFGDFKETKAADVPVNDRSGRHIAELVADGNRPCVIGMRGWTQGAMTRFWIDFASTLFARNAGELYLVGDEFHNFAPKQWKGQSDRDTPVGVALHWSNRLLSEGRGLGIVCLLASQRPQKVHNDTLTSCETLVAMRVVHAADRAAVKLWIDGNGDPEVGKEVMATLASIERGEGWVWSPEIGFGPKRVKFPLFGTFDSFAPPQLQKRVSGKGWADVDLAAVKEKLAAVIEEEKANDPRELKRQLAELRREIDRLRIEAAVPRPAPPAPAPHQKVKTVETLVIKDQQIQRLERLATRLDEMLPKAGAVLAALADRQAATKALGDQISGGIKALQDAIHNGANRLRNAAAPAPAPKTSSGPAIMSRAKPRENIPVRIPRATPDGGNGSASGELKKGERVMLLRVVQFAQMGGLTRSQLSILAGLRGGTFDRYLSTLRGGYVQVANGKIVPTQRGVDYFGGEAGGVPAAPSPAELVELWAGKFKAGERVILEKVLENPQGLSRGQLEELSDYHGGTFDRYLSTLRSAEVIEKNGDGLFRPNALLV